MNTLAYYLFLTTWPQEMPYCMSKIPRVRRNMYKSCPISSQFCKTKLCCEKLNSNEVMTKLRNVWIYLHPVVEMSWNFQILILCQHTFSWPNLSIVMSCFESLCERVSNWKRPYFGLKFGTEISSCPYFPKHQNILEMSAVH